MKTRYGIAEWYGEPFADMVPSRRQELAGVALGEAERLPVCPFQRGNVTCSKKGGVCSIQRYGMVSETRLMDRIAKREGMPVITCPRRFEQNDLIPKWLAEIVDFPDPFLAREVPFMRSTSTQKSAGRIDLVLANSKKLDRSSQWFGLEIQAVYFSGPSMTADFSLLRTDNGRLPPATTAVRRPDWRSSSAKRLMPQLQVKAPTLRRWLTKLAVAVDLPFFEAIGGKSAKPSQDINDGDIMWLIPRISEQYQLEAVHWEVLSLEDSSKKLLAADTIKREEFETVLSDKLRQLQPR